ncbi:MAG: hypothetical protein L6Q77_01400 [Bacteroidetes bacterium]|nr:hypothetical protein [Bacteroidota bacterium]
MMTAGFQDVQGYWEDFREFSYEEWLDLLPQPAGSPPDYSFLDDFHRLYFDENFSGLAPVIGGSPAGILIYSDRCPWEIQFLECFLPADQTAVLGMILTNHLTLHSLSVKKLSFRVWSHQETVITFLKSSR